MSRVEASSGARYSAHKESARRFEPIALVGTNYTPVGKVDIAAIRRNAPPAQAPSVSAPKPSIPTAPRPVPTAPAVSTGFRGAPYVPGRVNAPADSWDDEPQQAPAASFPPPPPPASNRPPVVSNLRPSVTSTTRPVPTAPSPVASSPTPTKPDEDDRIGPVGTAYTPIKLTPRKLVNPFAARQAQAQEEAQVEATTYKPQPTGILFPTASLGHSVIYTNDHSQIQQGKS